MERGEGNLGEQGGSLHGDTFLYSRRPVPFLPLLAYVFHVTSVL